MPQDFMTFKKAKEIDKKLSIEETFIQEEIEEEQTKEEE